MALTTMQKGNLDAAPADVHGRITKASVVLDGVTVTQVTFGPGARWSEDLKDYAGTDSCELPHVALVLAGQLDVRMDDGSVERFGPRDVMFLPPGHDAWTVGEAPCVFVEFSRGKGRTAASRRERRVSRRSPLGLSVGGRAPARRGHRRPSLAVLMTARGPPTSSISCVGSWAERCD